ncbi:hypothetical protein DFH27DRAFT_580013 [Peziza echinospora]|nr:hypothetical protein DFH27DRAFT_580013 [Peziza echinospora]
MAMGLPAELEMDMGLWLRGVAAGLAVGLDAWGCAASASSTSAANWAAIRGSRGPMACASRPAAACKSAGVTMLLACQCTFVLFSMIVSSAVRRL